MACSLNTISTIDDLSRIRAVLLPHLLDSLNDPNDQTTDTEDDDLPTSESVARTAALLSSYGKKKKKTSSGRNQWLRECKIAFSPTLNFLVTAFDQQIVVSTAKNKGSSQEQSNFTASFDTKLQVESNERITSVLCLPIASSTKRSSPEWTCIIVGFTSGYVRMYTEDGILLFSQIFHDESVVQLKCHTQFPSHIRSLIEQPDELYIQYRSSILVVIDGLSLYQLLKVCRDHALKSTNMLSSSSPQLSFKKWGFPDQTQMFDFASAGLITDNRFDQFCVASMTGGYQAQIRSVPPLFTRLITIGADPYCNFYYCAEGAQVFHLNEVAFALADKVKTSFMSAVSRWMPVKQTPTSAEMRKPKIESETKLESRFSIRDLRRHGEKIIVSPGLHIAAVCDSFGRIIVYDIHRGIAIRIFKGYREAEIGFIQIEESTIRDASMSLSSKKSALFLVIHAPKRQLVEIWGCQQGARVAAFNVSKNSHLINLEHYTLGWSSSGSNSSKLSQYKQCILLEENGEIKTFQIPFHLILSDRNNQRAHDIMIVRQVRRLLKESNDDNESLKTDILQQLKRLISLECQSEILDLVFHADYLDLNTIRMFINEIQIDSEKNSHHHNPQDSTHLQEFCNNALTLLNIYTVIEQYRTDHQLSISINEKLFSKEEFQNELELNDDETTLYYRLFEQEFQKRMNNSKKKVHFIVDDNENLFNTNFSFGQFQSMFISSRHSHSINDQLEIKLTINSEDFSLLGSYLFSSWLWYNDNEDFQEKFRTYLRLLHLKNDDLVLLCFHSLLSIPLNLPRSIQTWKQIFAILYSMNNNKNLLKITLEKSTNALTALLLSLIFRIYDKDFYSSLLIRRLSALVAIQNFYSSMKIHDEQNQSYDTTINELTVETIFIKHRHDYLLELLTRQIIDANISPTWLSINSTNENSFQTNLSICRQILPHTFEPTVLLIYSCWISMTMWNKQLLSAANSTLTLTNRTINDLFYQSLTFYNQIQIGIIKQNLGSLLWHTYLRSRIVTLTQLIEKIGKIPKDRLCYKELRLSEKDLINFLEKLSKDFFNTFIESIYNQLNEIPIFNIDDVWQIDTNTIFSDQLVEPISPFVNLYTTSLALEQNDQQNSLLDIVMEQKPANGHLVLHHDKLILILYYLMYYHIKSIRPYSLFDTKGIHAFFTDLYSHPLVTDDVDGTISNKRQLFFERLLNTIFEQHDNMKSFDEKIFENILRLSTDMLVDHEYIRRHYISLLYAYNYDNLAIHEENRIHDRQALAFQLLTIAGLRLNYFVDDNNSDLTTSKMSLKALEIRAKISSTLKTWMASLSSSVDYKVHSCSLEAIEAMLTRIGCYLPQTNLSLSNLAQEMMELVHLLER